MENVKNSVAIEAQFDGLIGPTHHFGGLGVGNVASQQSRWRPSHPKAAALEGLAKMRCVAGLGVPQFFLPPLPRPDWNFLASLGFEGDPGDILKRCGELHPQLLSAAYSSSFMWTANAATTAPATDTLDGRSHAMIANLCSSLHRGMEASGRMAQLQVLSAAEPSLKIHPPLPSVFPLRDEGAANHMRLCGASPESNSGGLHLFVHEPTTGIKQTVAPKYVSRQGALASRLVASRLQLKSECCVFIEQSQAAIDAGVFHNDVIATAHRNLMIYHEDAFVDRHRVLSEVRAGFERITGEPLIVIELLEQQLSLKEAVRTYLFNSQVVSRTDGAMHLVCPIQCQESAITRALIDHWIADSSIPIQGVNYLPLGESMANGGGPACLRLRWTLPAEWLIGPLQPYRWNEENAAAIEAWVDAHYSETLDFSDFLRLDFAQHVHHAANCFPTFRPSASQIAFSS